MIFIKEETQLVDKLDSQIEHNRYKAAWLTAEKVSDEEKNALSVDLDFLQQIHIILQELEYQIRDAIQAHNPDKSIQSYLIFLIKFLKAYKDIFSKLIDEEEDLLKYLSTKHK